MAKKKPITKAQKAGDWVVSVSDSPITPDGKYVAKLTRTYLNKLFVKYVYGETQEEAKQKAESTIKEYS